VYCAKIRDSKWLEEVAKKLQRKPEEVKIVEPIIANR
jgi:hypothetical protein